MVVGPDCQGADPQLSRTYFWFTGHPLVYFWLLPAYVSWYGMLPKQAGGKLFSDSLARLAMWLFLVLSVPLGFHHQFVDPGVPPVWKWIHAILTYSVFFPSMITAFTVIASLEYAGRQRGGKGLLGWIPKLPWGDPSVAAQLLAGILFLFGGIGGIINASYNINLVIHNTAWVPGHLHLTVATAVTLSFIGITYWLIPHITGRKLWRPKVAVAQAWVWFIGMIIFSNGMHTLGLLGAPRRTPLGMAPYVPPEWIRRQIQTGIGGAILLVVRGPVLRGRADRDAGAEARACGRGAGDPGRRIAARPAGNARLAWIAGRPGWSRPSSDHHRLRAAVDRPDQHYAVDVTRPARLVMCEDLSGFRYW